MTYRKDIDGLRALAIALVLAFHLYPGVLDGGFIGVDVFFVISGYLITGILLEAMSTGAFRYRDFYARRARRLLPSLLPVLVFCLIAGLFLQTPVAFYQLSRNILGGLLFVANFTLWADAGYFNLDQDSNPVLHLWSLGIEEQFYLVWPVLLLALFQCPWRYRVVALGLLLLVSFALNVMLVRSMPDLVFYFPFTRFWQLAAGALLVILQPSLKSLSQIGSNMLSTTGIFCILAAAFLLSRNTWYPGWWGVLPTIGTVMVLHGGPCSWLNRVLLSHPTMVWVGLVSYPLYLWHWPLFVFANAADPALPEGLLEPVVLAISVLLAWASYRLLEVPARRVHLPRVLGIAISVAAMVFVAAAATWYHQGWNARLPGSPEYPAKIAALVAPGFADDMASQWRAGTCFMDRGQGAENFVPECIDYRGSGKLVFLWGDSHAAALYPGLLALAEDRGFGIAQYTTNSCPPVPGWQGTINPLCREINDAILDHIEQTRPALLVLHAAWYMGEYANADLAGTLQQLQAMGITNVLVIGPPPLWADNVPNLIFDHYRESSQILPPIHDNELVWSVIEETGPAIQMLAEQQGAVYASLTDTLCNPAGCRLYFDDLLEVAFLDGAHLTPQAAVFAVRQLADKLIP